MESNRASHTEVSGKGELTRRHVVEAALSLFAERGFQKTSVRDIAGAAGTNVAAINYHFGSKDQLYCVALEQLAARSHSDLLGALRDAVETSGGRPRLEAVLEAAARAWGRPAGNTEVPDGNRLLDRELVEPRVGAQFLVEQFLEPVEQELGRALKAACPEASAPIIQVSIHLFLAQLSHLKRVRLHLAELGADRVPLLDPDEAIRNIVRFTSAGLRALAEEDSASCNDTAGGAR